MAASTAVTLSWVCIPTSGQDRVAPDLASVAFLLFSWRVYLPTMTFCQAGHELAQVLPIPPYKVLRLIRPWLLPLLGPVKLLGPSAL